MDKLREQMQPIVQKIEEIQEQIAAIQSECDHYLKEITIEGKDYYYSGQYCMKCGDSWLN